MNTHELIDYYCDVSENGREVADDIATAYQDGYEQGKRDAVVHGAWVYEGYDGRFVHSWHCSGCEHVIRGSANLTKAYSFCNRCGALMDAQEGVAVE